MSSCGLTAGSKYYIKAMGKNYYIYILASKKNGTLYIGITSDLIKRVWQHKEKLVEGFTKKYDVDKLVYYEPYTDPENAIKREKRLKFYKRQWKIDLIENSNPQWKDLYNDLVCGSCGQVYPPLAGRGMTCTGGSSHYAFAFYYI